MIISNIYLVANVISIRSIRPQMKLMIRNKGRQRQLHKLFQCNLPLVCIGPCNTHERSLAEVMDVVVVRLDSLFFPVIVPE